MSVLPVLSRGSVALKKIDELGLSLSSQAETTALWARSSRSLSQQIELDNITHTYHTDRDGQFTL
ncbi:MAG: ABC transporter ATP-binding protein, partial [Leptolyngbyaceae cyanobacterium SM2_5_2]|nr:ABC transporter ATP-binding protein [Leptolyngbyaceae cyanobacterium SM2_5_2]